MFIQRLYLTQRSSREISKIQLIDIMLISAFFRIR